MAKADDDKARRLAEALRDNLRRRKAQARGEELRHPGESPDLAGTDSAFPSRGPGLRRDDD